MRIFTFIGAAVALLVFTSDASAQVDPNEVYVQAISYDGSGCPAGSVGQSMANDRQSFTLIFDTFVASKGPGVPVTESRKNCHLNVQLHVPNGFQYSISTVDYRGYVQLPAGVTATQSSTSHFSGFTKQVTASTSFIGPVAKDYLNRDTMDFESVVWSPCGRPVPLNINAEVRLAGGTSAAQITTDSIDGKVKHVLGLQYRPCE